MCNRGHLGPNLVRKALKNALKKQCSQEQQSVNSDEPINTKCFQITLDIVSSEGEDTNDASSNGGNKLFSDAASMISHSAFSAISKPEEAATEDNSSAEDRLLT